MARATPTDKRTNAPRQEAAAIKLGIDHKRLHQLIEDLGVSPAIASQLEEKVALALMEHAGRKWANGHLAGFTESLQLLVDIRHQANGLLRSLDRIAPDFLFGLTFVADEEEKPGKALDLIGLNRSLHILSDSTSKLGARLKPKPAGRPEHDTLALAAERIFKMAHQATGEQPLFNRNGSKERPGHFTNAAGLFLAETMRLAEPGLDDPKLISLIYKLRRAERLPPAARTRRSKFVGGKIAANRG